MIAAPRREAAPTSPWACIEVPLEEARAFGVMAVDASGTASPKFAEKPAHPEPMPGRADVRAGLDGHLRLQHRSAARGAAVDDADDADSTHDFGKNIIPRCHRAAAGVRLSVPRRADAARRATGATWAPSMPSGEANLELIGVTPGAQPLRRGVADLDLPGAAAAGEVRARRRGPPRHGGQLDGRRRLHHLRCRGAPLAAVLATCASHSLLHDRATR